jgi:hypothetical protein
MVIAVLHSDRRPRQILIQRQRARACELQAGNQRAGYCHATAQRATGLRATNRREESRQRAAVRQRSKQLAHTRDRVADLPEWRRPGTIGIRLVWHTQCYQAGPQQFGDITDPSVIVATIPCPAPEHIASELGPALKPVRRCAHLRPADQPMPQRLCFVLCDVGLGRVARQQQTRAEEGQARRHDQPDAPAP